MIVLAKHPLGSSMLLRNGKKAGDNGRASNDDIGPVQVNKRRLRKDDEIGPEVTKGRYDSLSAGWSAIFVFQRHDIPFFLLGRLRGKIAGASFDLVLMSIKDRHEIGMLGCFMIWLLSKDLAELGVILLVRLQELQHRGLGMGGHVLDELVMFRWQRRHGDRLLYRSHGGVSSQLVYFASSEKVVLGAKRTDDERSDEVAKQ